MKVLLTGVTGFIGSHTADLARAAGHEVRALVRQGHDTSALAAAGVDIARGDVTDPGAVEKAVAGCEAVIHVAGVIRAKDEAGFARVNVFGARNVASACARGRVRRLVLVSSLAARGPRDAGGPVTPYGRSKLAGEIATLEAAGSTEVVIVRPTAVYGPRDRAILPYFQLAARGIRPVLGGAGSLSFVLGPDLARALVGLLAARTEHGNIYEAADGRDYAWEEVMGAIADAVGRPGRPFSVPKAAVAAIATLSGLWGRVSGVPQVLTRDKLPEIFGAWPADATALWRDAGVGEPTSFAEGARHTARCYRDAGWI